MANQTKLTIPTRDRDIKREWFLVDVKDKVLGRVATEIAGYLMGKDKPYFVRNLDMGNFVVVVNCKDVKVTGNKRKQKTYENYSGYPGGRKVKTFETVIQDHPERVIREAVSGMLPHNKLHDILMSRLYIYPDDSHPYESKFKIKN
ncbi:MAG: 50S ribosomal protein L13 [Candidatus Gottesmanbacteria bacterium GW2011_GWA2_41_12]|uniref:Large ribosomal subunit protein uL13 n=2 Tax=Candidatus Gottesmaniibacteriota TaxID=1752720 RepID=A0A0G0UI41_9BACT|nr:MAG: 50S ribosomal protein L13 [Candidatus Gottesmanbacteria bacterium GW2011_GWC2_39_8]KKR88493.1 MAG: 50S ribosomal protein L13 [Candidatus Gottesmanbacteria bacterium GW2011_GWA2_41_12]